MKTLVLGAALSAFAALAVGCDAGEASPDDTLRAHVIESGTHTAETRAYVGAVMAAHEQAARAATADEKMTALRHGLALPAPANMMEASILRLELAVALCETLESARGGESAALSLLQPMLAPQKSLPVHRVTARALVTLGDLAQETGDDALAAGSYARSIKMMSMLQQELMP